MHSSNGRLACSWYLAVPALFLLVTLTVRCVSLAEDNDKLGAKVRVLQSISESDRTKIELLTTEAENRLRELEKLEGDQKILQTNLVEQARKLEEERELREAVTNQLYLEKRESESSRQKVDNCMDRQEAVDSVSYSS